MRYLLRDGYAVTDTSGQDFDRVATAAEREWWTLIQRLRGPHGRQMTVTCQPCDCQSNCLAKSEAERLTYAEGGDEIT
jgi:hypothetical protein